MEFPNLAPLNVSLRGIFWLHASKDGGGASLADLIVLAVLKESMSFKVIASLNQA